MKLFVVVPDIAAACLSCIVILFGVAAAVAKVQVRGGPWATVVFAGGASGIKTAVQIAATGIGYQEISASGRSFGFRLRTDKRRGRLSAKIFPD